MESSRRLELIENACVKMKTSGHKDTFIRLAVEKGIRAYNERVSRSKLEEDHPGFQPLYPKAGWKKDLRSKEKALKRGNWFKGKDDKTETFLHETGGGVKKKPFLKAGWKNKLRKSAATVVFVPSTRGGTLVRMLMEDEDKMAEMSGFRVKYQEAGGSILANAFEKDLGSGQHCGRAACPPCQIPGERGNCKKKNVVYESCCEVCNPVSNHQEDQDHPPGRAKTPREGVYIGETSHPDLPSPPTMIFSVKSTV